MHGNTSERNSSIIFLYSKATSLEFPKVESDGRNGTEIFP
jgi:hypothetical protein